MYDIVIQYWLHKKFTLCDSFAHVCATSSVIIEFENQQWVLGCQQPPDLIITTNNRWLKRFSREHQKICNTFQLWINVSWCNVMWYLIKCLIDYRLILGHLPSLWMKVNMSICIFLISRDKRSDITQEFIVYLEAKDFRVWAYSLSNDFIIECIKNIFLTLFENWYIHIYM